ncbi:hypothetical protein JT886_003196 [Salmonella enterica]|nr:hypothetical protein [Salmonella enterica]
MSENDGFKEARERAFYHGCVLAYDSKEGMDIVSFGHFCDESYDLIYDDDMLFYLYKSLSDYFHQLHDVDDYPDYRLLKETLSSEEFKLRFSEFLDELIFFRLNENISVDDMDFVDGILSEQCFFYPRFIWVEGKMTYDF